MSAPRLGGRVLLAGLAALDAGLTFGLAPEVAGERTLLATAAIRVFLVAGVAVSARRPGHGLRIVIATSAVRSPPCD